MLYARDTTQNMTFGPSVLPDLTVHVDLTDDFTLRAGAGYMFAPSMHGMSGPLLRMGMSF
ncbi:hypothetical protein D3C78_1664630 [compost metagenome]